MVRPWCWTLLLCVSIVPLSAPAMAGTDPLGPPLTFFFSGGSQGLRLQELAPQASEATTWARTGHYDSRNGLVLQIPVANPVPELLVDEAHEAEGMVKWRFQQQPTTSVPFAYYSTYGTFSWHLVEGKRSVRMQEPCFQYDYEARENRPCEGTKGLYHAAFPGHAGEGTPHSHGEGGLRAGDFHWLLEYRVAACTSLLCLPGTTMKYTFEVVVDGSTFVHVATPAAVEEEAPVEAPCHHEEPSDEETTETGNETANETGNSEGPSEEEPVGNETGNESASASGAKNYRVQQAAGTSPGAPVLAVLVAGAAMALVRRRRSG